MILLLNIASAVWSAPAALAIGAQGFVPGASDDLYAAGIAAGAGWSLGERASVEGALDYGYSLGRPEAQLHRLYLRPQLRYYATPHQNGAPALSLSIGAGMVALGGLEDLGPSGDLGISMDLPSSGPIHLRVTGGYARSAGALNGGGYLALSAVRALEPASADAAPPRPPEVWVPAPVCEWMDPSLAAPILAELEASTMSEAPPDAPAEPEGALESEVLSSGAPEERAPERSQGNLLIVAHPGDQVLVGDQIIQVTNEGSVVLTASEGTIDVTIRGGGRIIEREFLVLSGYVSWERVPAPEPQQIFFEVGSSHVDAAAMERLSALVEALGGYALSLEGSFSPEGELGDNQDLARDRARAVGQALVEMGVQPERLRYLEPGETHPDLSNEALRNVSITPYALEADP